MTPVRIGTRASDLALWQANHVSERLRHAHPGIAIEVVRITTTGDALADAPLERMEGIGFFTSTIERALLAGEIDLAVHSYKDLPTVATPGLQIGAVPPRGPIEDVLCARDRRTLVTLARGARVGTSSPRRTAQLRALRPDLEFVALRGNVPTRIEKVAAGELDAAVLARAGLERLGLAAHITEIFAIERVLPAPAQGALALQARATDAATLRLLAALDHAATRRAVAAERTVLNALRGGCSVPVGAWAHDVDGELTLDAGVFAIGDGRAVRVRRSGTDPIAIGEEVAAWLLAHGADRVLAEIDRTPRLAAPGAR